VKVSQKKAECISDILMKHHEMEKPAGEAVTIGMRRGAWYLLTRVHFLDSCYSLNA
jgi:hypothetical protein